MKLKSIRMNGFKSFADKTDLEFKTNITAIVGPNGSGKSNIVDAVKWVLGEQSVKSLRGSTSMSDVIFAGSESRDALKRAEVALTFDNTEHFLNTDLVDVEVKRVLYQNGENEYFINNHKVRLKDITTLFLDSGIGNDTFHIISQGSIEAIVNSKPIDRRVIIEGASKVLKYKTRKQESVKKLEKTKDNLEKVTLVTDELSLSVLPLKEQSEIAKKYLSFKEELENLEISLTTFDISQIHETYHQTMAEMKELEKKKEKLELTFSKENVDTENFHLELLKIEERYNDLNKEYMEVLEKISKLQSEKTLFQERQKYVIDEEKVNESLLSFKEQELALQKELELIQNDLEEIRKNINEEKNKLRDEEESFSMLSIKKKHIDVELEQTLQNQFSLQNKIRLLEANLEQDMSLPVAVKNILNHPRLTGICGTIGKLLEVVDYYATAIDVALGASANFIVSESETDAKNAIEYLKNNRLGRATFFPLNVIRSRKIPNTELASIENEKGFLGVASDLIQYDSKYQNIMENQLGNVLVVEDFDTLQRLGNKLSHKYRIVTLDGEIMHAGGSLTGGFLKPQNSTLKEKQELSHYKEELENNLISTNSLQEKKKEMESEKEELSERIQDLERKILRLEEGESQKDAQRKTLEEKLQEARTNLKNADSLKKGKLEEDFMQLLEQIKEEEVKKELCEKEMETLKTKKSDLSSQINELEKNNREKSSAYHSVEMAIKDHEVEIGKLDTKMDYLLGVLSDEYHITYEKAKNEYTLDLEPELARMRVTSLKKSMQELGEVNLGSISEYDRVKDRYEFLMNQKTDLEHAMEELYHMIEEMDSIMEERLTNAFQKIQKEFEITFKKLFQGGRGMLKLTDPEHILETGIEIIAEPPGKKLNNIQLLSGGEKTLTAIALLFAILNVYPVPFCILDEVEAALDEANVDMFGSYLQEQQDKSEFILITHKKRTMEYATTLYGITMQEQGVSKIVSVSLEGTK